MNLNELYSNLIKDHNLAQHNKRPLANATVTVPGKNPSCGDEIVLSLDVEEGIIVDGSFLGVGCAISQASTSIMLDLIRGKTVSEASELSHMFLEMIRGEEVTEEALDRLEDAVALKGISKMPARVKCATMGWHTLLVALNNAG